MLAVPVMGVNFFAVDDGSESAAVNLGFNVLQSQFREVHFIASADHLHAVKLFENLQNGDDYFTAYHTR